MGFHRVLPLLVVAVVPLVLGLDNGLCMRPPMGYNVITSGPALSIGRRGVAAPAGSPAGLPRPLITLHTRPLVGTARKPVPREHTWRCKVGTAVQLGGLTWAVPARCPQTYMAGVDVLTIAKFFVSSGLRESGYEYVNSDEGWEQKQRDKKTGRIVPGPGFGGSDAGMKALVAQVHGMGLKLGLYGAASGVTCGTMPGQLYHEDLDAQTYADCESRRYDTAASCLWLDL